MNKVDRDTLYEQYIVLGKPMYQIAQELKISVGTVYNYLKKYGIKSRSKKESFEILSQKGCRYPDSAREKISKAHKGKVVSDETKGKISYADKIGGIGHKKKRSDGYISIYFPDHPKSTKDGYIMEHILVMECIIGRHLYDDEVVHHINGVRDDNRKENLKLMTFKEHASYHMKKRYEKRRNDLSTK